MPGHPVVLSVAKDFSARNSDSPAVAAPGRFLVAEFILSEAEGLLKTTDAGSCA